MNVAGNSHAAGSASSEVFHPRIEAKHGCLALWGTRGSMPTPGAAFLRHGGHTSCMSITRGDALYVFDAGSGIRDLGLELMTTNIRDVHVFITHTHWDHIQGFPFFAPAYAPEFHLTIYGPRRSSEDLQAIFSGQLERDYFPVQLKDMKAEIDFVSLDQAAIEHAGMRISWELSNHPGATVGYKISVDGMTLAWVPDNEFLQGYVGAPDEVVPDDEFVAPFREMIEFLFGVDLLIHEAQYMNEEYAKKIGWGHSCLSNVCLLAKFAKVRRWLVTHHDPMHDDHFLETKLNVTRQLLERVGYSIPVAHAYDGLKEYF